MLGQLRYFLEGLKDTLVGILREIGLVERSIPDLSVAGVHLVGDYSLT